jgi:hypothetical protein
MPASDAGAWNPLPYPDRDIHREVILLRCRQTDRLGTGRRDMIAEDILRPGQVARLGFDFELRFKHFLVVVVVRTQHHSVLAEQDWPLISKAKHWPRCRTSLF